MSWIDFRRLRAELRFADLLDHYKVEFRMKGDRATAFCPLPDHRGQRRSPSFSADLKRGLFQCFGCGAKGNCLEFACIMEHVDPQNSREFHRVAGMLHERFLGSPSNDRSRNGKNDRANAGGSRAGRNDAPPPQKRNVPRGGEQNLRPRNEALPVVVNPPLDFELKSLDPEHPYLAKRGFIPDTVKHFGLGFCNRGSLKDRIAIPLRDMTDNLIGYAGRVIDDKVITADNPKYLFPSEREREGKLLQFKKSVFLYNGSSIRQPVKDLVVVEGFASTWWLWQNGIPNVVALMGASCSKEQADLITSLVQPNGIIWAMTDGDDAGRRCAGSVFVQIEPARIVRFVKLDEGVQPTDWTPEDLLGSFGSVEKESGSSELPLRPTPIKRKTKKATGPAAAIE